MAILRSHIHLLCREWDRHPVRGRALTLGRLRVLPDCRAVTSILNGYGFDAATLPPDGPLHGGLLLKALGAGDVEALDVDAYEGADVIWNLNDAVPAGLEERFDFILDGGTLEHVFDLPQAMSNLVRMTRVGGTVAIMAPASNSVDHGFYSVSPTLLFDYFGANGFGALSCYLAELFSCDYSRPVSVYTYPSVGGEYRMSSGDTLYTVFFATKLHPSPAQSVKPIQSLYRKLHNATRCLPADRSLGRRCRDMVLRYAPRPILRPIVERRRRSGLRLVGRW
jgi:hypothetical protein